LGGDGDWDGARGRSKWERRMQREQCVWRVVRAEWPAGGGRYIIYRGGALNSGVVPKGRR
jgi:hypothetical protein